MQMFCAQACATTPYIACPQQGTDEAVLCSTRLRNTVVSLQGIVRQSWRDVQQVQTLLHKHMDGLSPAAEACC